MTKKNVFVLTILILFALPSIAQSLTLDGIVSDSINKPLEYVNVLAIPHNEEYNIVFSITDEKGNYKLSLLEKVPYSLEISYLGFEKWTESISLEKSRSKNFVLIPSSQSLDEVLIKQRLAVKVTEDTITYRADVFTTGNERKLREVLKKLPGVEVDRYGNVTVNGKKIDKLLVEGKVFFSGDTKLGVNNIPANAVDEVEVLDNYTEIAFLKGLNESNILAMNIKLKEDKKRFVFGDIEIGGGIEDRYLANSNLFYYSKKNSANFIGDLNNIGKKSFSLGDYLNFEGGFAKYVDDPVAYVDVVNSDFAQSLLNQDFTFNKNQFGAGSFTHQFSPKTNLSAYTILNVSNIDTQTNDLKVYLVNNEISNTEERAASEVTDNVFSLSKITLKYKPTFEEDLTFETLVKTSNGNAFEKLESLNSSGANFVQSENAPNSFSIVQNTAFNKQFSSRHTSTLSAKLRFDKNDRDTKWRLSESIFPNILPIEGEGPFSINQRIKSRNYSANLSLKHYWVVSDLHHIYPILGYNFSRQEYESRDQQDVNNNIVNFSGSGFNNDTSFLLNDAYAGLQYKTRIGNITFKPGLIYHYYLWNSKQLFELRKSQVKPQLLPELTIKWDIKDSEKLSFKYNLRSQFNDVSFFSKRLRLQSFNSIYRGNDQLENSLSHLASLYYFRFNLLRGLFYSGGVNYSKTTRSIRNNTSIEGIDQINSSFYSTLPESNLVFNGSLSKKIDVVKFTINGGLSFSEYQRNVNTQIVAYRGDSFNYTFKTESFFKNYPNIELGITQNFNSFSSSSFGNDFVLSNLFGVLDYTLLNDITIRANYNYSIYKNNNENTNNIFQIGDSAVLYNREDSPWSFEIEGSNIFDVRYKNQSSFNEFIINDTQIFIQPRTVLFKISYQL